MVQELTKQPVSYQWALPENVEVPADELKVRLDFYGQSVVMYVMADGIITTKMVSAQDIALALLRDIPLGSGVLPENTLWWQHRQDGEPVVALWRPPQVWPAALQLEPFKPPRRFKLPMPGLIFICRPGSPPGVVAAKKRPTTPEDPIFRAPLYNVYTDGNTCPGSHKYSEGVSKIPEEFFMSFFTQALGGEVSRKHGHDLLKLWESIDGKRRYPLRDLMPCGKVANLLK
ncbi:unnamed protein product [marine sediment metagenome]|uniref:PRTRC system protein B n=1 Tax=marine sediment metagenome TaxID=412755 RepID=X1R0Q6_9ZZZZ